MPQNERSATGAPCVSASDTDAGQQLDRAAAQQASEASAPQLPVAVHEIPRTASPSEVWHPESYLIACLVRHHGWRVLEPGHLRRYEMARSMSTVQKAA